MSIQQETSNKKITLGRVLLWIFFLPIMAIITIWKAERLSFPLKVVLTGLVIAICIMVFPLSRSNRKAAYNSQQSNTRIAVATEIADRKESSAPTRKPTNTPKATVKTTEQPTPSPTTDTTVRTGIRPEFQKMMDEYLQFFKEYCDFMKKYMESPDASMMTQYYDMMQHYMEAMEALDEIDADELSQEELKLYLDTTNEINKMLLDLS